jgi:hypothetical protein
VATSVIFVQNISPSSDDIYHIVVRRTLATKRNLSFEVDHYDINRIPKDLALCEPYIWKSSLLGDLSLFTIIKQHERFRTFGKFLSEKIVLNGWSVGEGYKRESKITEFKEKHKADHLTGKKMVPTKCFTEEEIKCTITEKAEFFGRSRIENKNIFKGPHILFKNALGKQKLPIHLVHEDLGFMREIVGINSPASDVNDLEEIVNRFRRNSDLYRCFLVGRSGRAGIDRSIYTLKFEDFLELPYPEDIQQLEPSKIDNIIIQDILNYRIEELSKGENSKLNKLTTKQDDLIKYSDVLITYLNSIYQVGENRFYSTPPIFTNFYIFHFCHYGKHSNSSISNNSLNEEMVQELIENNFNTIHFKRVLKIYKKDIFILIKPKAIRYWLKSIAIRDASDIVSDLFNNGY